ncbi:hypothetical protein Vafri_18866 [Volvox africanus]|uniref:Uncharacterized protein n=1 Tax=Volvox africanus TaxID=51714 RepID=A0A8J4F8W2_9CHLO|nr:hypothetical protein Vafri_18866 [Volvox africanus]
MSNPGSNSKPSNWKADDSYYQEWKNFATSAEERRDVFWHPCVGEVLLVADEQGHVSLWSIVSRALLWSSGCICNSSAAGSTNGDGAADQRQLYSLVDFRTRTTAWQALSSGRAFYTGHADGSVRKWEIEQQQSSNGDRRCSCHCILKVTCSDPVIQQCDLHVSIIISLAVSLDERRILTTTKGMVICWDTDNMNELDRCATNDEVVTCSAISEDGTKAIVLTQPVRSPLTVLLWDMVVKKVEKRLLKGLTGSFDGVYGISWPAHLVAAANGDGDLFVWDAESGHLRYKTNFNHGDRSCCRFSPCGLFMLVGGRSRGELVLLESKYGQELLRAYPPEGPDQSIMAWSCFFLPASYSYLLPSERVQDDIRQPPSLSQPNTHNTAHTRRPQIRDETRREAGNGDGKGEVALTVTSEIDTSNPGGCGRDTCPPEDDAYRGFKRRYFGFTRDGLTETTSISSPFKFPTRFGAVYSDGSIRFFNMDGVSYTKSHQLDMISGDEVFDLDVSRDGTLLFAVVRPTGRPLASSDEYQLKVYDLQRDKLIWQTSEAFSTRSSVLDSCVSSDRYAGLVSYHNGDIRNSGNHNCGGGERQWQMRGKVAVSGGRQGEIQVFDLSARKLIQTIVTETQHRESGTVHSQFNNDFTKVLTTAGDDWVCLWDMYTGKMTRKYDKIHRKGIFGAWFTTDGSRCISVSEDKTATLFKLNDTGEVIMRFKGHKDRVISAALSPNEAILATASKDETVRIWDVDDGTMLRIIQPGISIELVFLHSTRILTTDARGNVIGFGILVQQSATDGISKDKQLCRPHLAFLTSHPRPARACIFKAVLSRNAVF